MSDTFTGQSDPTVVESNEFTSDYAVVDRCKEWCFLPGLSHIGPQGLLQCFLVKNHEEEHTIIVNILSPPVGTFTINWTRKNDAEETWLQAAEG